MERETDEEPYPSQLSVNDTSLWIHKARSSSLKVQELLVCKCSGQYLGNGLCVMRSERLTSAEAIHTKA